MLASRNSAGSRESHAAEGPGSGGGGDQRAGLAAGSGAAATTTNATEAVSVFLSKEPTKLYGHDTGSIFCASPVHL